MMSFFMDLVFLSEEIGSHAYFKPTLFFETGSNYVAQPRLKAVVILLPQPSKCKDHWCGPPGLALQAFGTLGTKQNNLRIQNTAKDLVLGP